jgi:hypothetical protein
VRSEVTDKQARLRRNLSGSASSTSDFTTRNALHVHVFRAAQPRVFQFSLDSINSIKEPTVPVNSQNRTYSCVCDLCLYGETR